MTTLPAKVKDRLTAGIKKFRRILDDARARELNEAETSRRVQEMLVEIFGFDRLEEITCELEAHGQSCDLAIILDGKIDTPRLLIEVKAIALKLRDDHVKQAVNYGSNKGTKWAVLTNGTEWRIYKVAFPKVGCPLEESLVASFDFLDVDAKNDETLEKLYLLTKESLAHSALEDYEEHQEAMSRFFLGAVILSDPVLEVIRRELRRAVPGVKTGIDEIRSKLEDDVLRTEVHNGPKFDEAKRALKKAQHNKAQSGGIATAKAAEGLEIEVPSSTLGIVAPAASPSVSPPAS